MGNLFEDKKVKNHKSHHNKNGSVRLFYFICFLILLIVALDFSKIWGILGFLLPAIAFCGLLFNFIPLAVLGVPLTLAYPWVMWLYGRSTSFLFWFILFLYSIYFIFKNWQAKRKNQT